MHTAAPTPGHDRARADRRSTSRRGWPARGLLLVVVGGILGLGVWLVVGGRDSPPGIATVDLDPASVTGCLPVEITVTLDGAAPAGGEIVALRASSTTLEVPSQVTVPAGRTRASVTAATAPVAAGEAVELQAAMARSAATASLQVVPVEAAALGADPDPTCLAGFTEHHGYAQPERTGSFDAELIPEASGLAASRRNPGWLYVVDDEAPTEVWAMRTDGSDLRAIPVEGFTGRDTEALGVGPCGPDTAETCVYVGDIGDNLGQWPDVAILRFPEPDLAGPVTPVAADTIRVRYPDGAVDAEALLVDEAGNLAIVTKEPGPDRAGAARLFTVDGFADATLVDRGPVVVPAPTLPLVATFLGVLVTGGDYADGRVLLRTYDHVVEYVAPHPDAPLWAFPSWPAREVPAAREPQSEAVAHAADGCGYFTVSEIVGDIWFSDCAR